MPQYTIPLQGGGSMTVNASSQAAAINNVLGTGNTPAGSGSGGGGSSGISAPSSTSGGGGTAQFNTVNGLQTVASMAQQLQNAGWQGNISDPAAVVAAYASTTHGAVTPSGTTYSGGGGGGGGAAGGGAAAAVPGAADLGATIQSIINALATGNKAAFDEAVRQFNATFGLDQQKFAEATRQFNATFGLQQAGVTGRLAPTANDYAVFAQRDPTAANLAAANPALLDPTYQRTLQDARGYVFYPGEQVGQATEAARQFNVTTGLNAAQLAASLHADPFRQRQVEGQLGRLLQGQGVAGFQSPTGSAADTSSIDYILNQIRNPTASAASDAMLSAIPAPNQVSAPDFFRSSPGTQDLLLSGIKARYGLDEADALAQIRNTLPQFRSPALTGSVHI
jgi:hypothetical protein